MPSANWLVVRWGSFVVLTPSGGEAMCIALVALGHSSTFPLVVLHNRDEVHQRQSDKAAWHGDLFFPRDREGGGTWFAVTKHGTFACLTNHRDPRLWRANTRSRGDIVPGVLRTGTLPEVHAYNPFNLIQGSGERASVLSSLEQTQIPLSRGIAVLSNGPLGAPWPKSKRLCRKVSADLDRHHQVSSLAEALFTSLSDRKKTFFGLPKTGVSYAREVMLSSIFIRSPRYGTKSSIVLIGDAAGVFHWFQRDFDAWGRIKDECYERVPTARGPRAPP